MLQQALLKYPAAICVVGPYSSSAALRLYPVAAAANVPLFSHGATSLLLSDSAQYPWFVRPLDSVGYITAIFTLVQKIGANRVAMIYTDNPTFQFNAAQARKQLPLMGVSISTEIAVSENNVPNDCLKAIQAMANDHAVVILMFVSNYVPFQTAIMSTGYYGAGIYYLFNSQSNTLATTTYTTSAAVASHGWLLNARFYDPQFFASDQFASYTQQFLSYTGTNWTDGGFDGCNIFCPLIYDVVSTISVAIQNLKAKSTPVTGTSLLTAIRAVNFQGITGQFYFDPLNPNNRQGQVKALGLYVVQNGVTVNAGTFDSTFTPILSNTFPTLATSSWFCDGGSSYFNNLSATGATPGALGKCVSCALGTYLDHNVGTCRACASTQMCPIKSDLPVNQSAAFLKGFSLSRPFATGTVVSSETTDAIMVQVWSSYVGVLCLFLLILVLLWKSPKQPMVVTLFTKLDMLDMNHPNFVGFPVIPHKNYRGGIATLMIVILSLFVLSFILTLQIQGSYELQMAPEYTPLTTQNIQPVSIVVTVFGMDNYRVCLACDSHLFDMYVIG